MRLVYNNLGDNLEGGVEEDGSVYLKFDPSVRLGLSQSGKTVLVSKTGKAKRIGDTDVFLNLTAYVYPKKGGVA